MFRHKLRLFTLLLTFVLFAGATMAQAAGPYLVCDPYAAAVGVTSFTVFWDGATTGVSAPVLTDATGTYLHLDLTSLSNGSHTVKVRAKNSWGESLDSAPFAFVKQVPPTPLNIRISAN